jgi:uncharacterized protein involved in oxidation of intracellular sulfur
MRFLIILNDPPYGTERSYNALRLARTLALKEGTELRVFLIGDAVGCAVAGQKTPDGYYNLDTMLRSLARKGASIGCCGTCMDARGITEAMLSDGAHRSSMDELAEWTVWAEKVITF